jgi:periplasmic protein CpxP/Spy
MGRAHIANEAIFPDRYRQESLMTDQHHSDPPAAAEPRQQVPRTRRWALLTSGALVAALTGAVASQALSQGGPPWAAHGFGGFRMGEPLDPARAEDRVDRMIRHLAIEIDATTEQQDKLRSIAKAAVRDLLPLRDKLLAGRMRARELFIQPSIDRTAIEALRSQQISLVDQASRRLAQAMADAAEALNPDQRVKVQEYLASRRGHWRRG